MTTPTIHATSQQTRFHIQETLTTTDLDLKGVTVSIGGKEVVSDAHLKLSPGVHYVLVGRNGVGKSTLMKAIGEKLIPGIQKGLRVLLLQQRYGEREEGGKRLVEGKGCTVLEYVVKSDKVRTETLRRTEMLRKVLDDNNDPTAAVKVLRQLKHEDRGKTLEEAKKEAMLRSGARGMKARKELKALEIEYAEWEAKLDTIDENTLAQEVDEAHQLLAELETALEEMSAATAEARAEALLLGLGFTTTTISKPFTALSGGWQMRTILASLLFQPCDILLLDEPTNFLDLPALLWLETHLLNRTDTTLLLVTHDRAFADTLADEIIVLRDAKLERFSGNLTAYQAVRKEKQRRLQKMKDAQDKQKAHIEETIAGNIRAAKASGDDKKLKQAASRQKKLDERMGYQVGINGGKFKLNRDLAGYHLSMRDEIVIPQDDPAAKLSIPKTPPELRFPGPLVICDKLTFKYKAASEPVLKGVNLTVHLHDRIGLMGLNGAGKSTLVSCLVGKPNPGGKITSGAVTHHSMCRIGYFTQHSVGTLPSQETALSYLSSSNPDSTEQTIRGALSAIGLSGQTVSHIPLSMLSGGQRVRVALLKILFPHPPHLLVLDEATTHLDAESVEALAGELRGYEGAVVVVSHDRWFVREVVEGVGGDGDEEDEEEIDRGKEVVGVREVYAVGAGEVKKLKGGVEAFEKRVRKKVSGQGKV